MDRDVTQLSTITGEFRNPDMEAAFQADRLPESQRHARLLFLLSALLNALFLLSDWRFAGTPHFRVAVPPASLSRSGRWPACRSAVIW